MWTHLQVSRTDIPIALATYRCLTMWIVESWEELLYPESWLPLQISTYVESSAGEENCYTQSPGYHYRYLPMWIVESSAVEKNCYSQSPGYLQMSTYVDGGLTTASAHSLVKSKNTY